MNSFSYFTGRAFCLSFHFYLINTFQRVFTVILELKYIWNVKLKYGKYECWTKHRTEHWWVYFIHGEK